ncbi:2-phospho-L-lactate guanylyltransferase CofC [Streptomyces sp. SPB074]|nr:2-phospho-L-lactate guanylyltransferase [Streptomyces sp. SPB074]EDY46266.1 2-phospho-L-lactate guanylyltransferase CofC [Streptomyces sp. SPB074]
MNTPAGPTSTPPWTLVVPVKPLPLAKSRLAGPLSAPSRRRLALAFAQDTVAAALACAGVRGVVVVTDDARGGAALAALGARVVPDTPATGLNAALAHGARAARRGTPRGAVAALNADLPALRPAELSAVLRAAAHFPRSFLPDAAEIGTTFLAALSGTELGPLFGGHSRKRHRDSGAAELGPPAVASVRQDVDTVADLRAALALGVGPHTRRVVATLPAGERLAGLSGTRQPPPPCDVPAAHRCPGPR